MKIKAVSISVVFTKDNNDNIFNGPFIVKHKISDSESENAVVYNEFKTNNLKEALKEFLLKLE